MRAQHDVIEWSQLLAHGISRHGIAHRVRKGRLHPLWPKVYAVGTPHVSQLGLWMAAVLTCGEGALLSHVSAAALRGIRRQLSGPIHVSVPANRDPRRKGIRVHRRADALERTIHDRIPTTSPTQTLFDLAATLDQVDLERAINEADKLDAVHVKQLHEAAKVSRSRGAARVKALIEKQTLLLTDSELERRFIPIAKRAGLSTPHSQAWVNGFRVDFYFDGEALIVEMDGGRFHRAGPAARGPDPRPRAYARRRDGAPVHPRTDHP